MRTILVGEAKVSLINLGDLGFRLKDVENVPESEWKNSAYANVFENSHPYPSQSVFISHGELSVLVDAGEYSLFATSDSPYRIPGYVPPPNLVDQLSEIGIRAEDVDYVVITHAHYDHYAGVTRKNGTEYVPTFPNATYLLGREDYENPEMKKSIQDENSDDNHTFGVLWMKGILELVQSKRVISDEIEILASPGESPGHKILRLHSHGETIYCLGDLFHHACEVQNPSWMASWDDPKANLKSRLELLDSALKANAILLPAHMPPGRLEKTSSGFRYADM